MLFFQIIRRLKTVESLNESLGITDLSRRFKQGSRLQEKAEKIFMSHMEIIRLKYPTTLHRLQDCSPLPASEFGLIFSASRPIILVGLGVFLPHGENIVSPLRFRVWVQEYAAQVYGPRGRTVAAEEVELSVREQLDHGRMCIDHELGNRIRRGVECLAPPRHIDSQRKFKRRCFGVHPWPVQLRQSAEILTDRPYHIGLRMSYCGGGGGGGGGGGAGAIFPDGEMSSRPVETVWGGGGDAEMDAGGGLKLRFTRCGRTDLRSSATSGQIPFLFYM